jgi:hypothetical protein
MQLMTKKGKIRRLIEIAAEGDGETGHRDRLNRAERLFFEKHPDWIQRAFVGSKPHVRADEIVRKMSLFDLNTGDVETVHRALINGPVISKPFSIFLKLKGLVGHE